MAINSLAKLGTCISITFRLIDTFPYLKDITEQLKSLKKCYKTPQAAKMHPHIKGEKYLTNLGCYVNYCMYIQRLAIFKNLNFNRHYKYPNGQNSLRLRMK